jgi:hypothetical protein
MCAKNGPMAHEAVRHLRYIQEVRYGSGNEPSRFSAEVSIAEADVAN